MPEHHTNPQVQASLQRVLDSVKQLPSPPELCLSVTRAAQNAQTTIEQLQMLVESDIALSGRLMQVANSAFFGVRQPVTSVRRAIALLGFNAVRTLALGFFFHEEYGKLRIAGLPYPDLPRYALAASVLAECIAGQVDADLAPDAACLGLLHESGVLVMAMAFGARYRRMLASMTSRRYDLQDAESRAFGINHADAGKLLLAGWRLDASFVEAATSHHADAFPRDDDGPAATIWRIIRVAASGALLFFGADNDEPAREAAALAESHFRWQPAQFGDVLRLSARAYESRTAVMGLGPASVAGDVETLTRTVRLLGAA